MPKSYKRTYLESLKSVIPEVYFNEDFSISGLQRTATDSLINSHINFCINQPSILGISATDNYTELDTVSGMAQWFLPKNKLTEVNSRDFELGIMHPLGFCIGEHTGQPCTYFTGDSGVSSFVLNQEKDFINFLEVSVLPKISLNSSSLAETTVSAFSPTASGTHEYLINLLGWAYFLNTSGSNISTSSYVASSIADTYYTNKIFNTNTGIKGLTEYLWHNWGSVSSISSDVLPINYYSGTGEFVSGTQNLKGLTTLVDVAYSELPSDIEDTYVKDSFDSYIEYGTFLTGQELAAPFSKFLQAASYTFFDVNDQVAGIGDLYDIEKCPAHLLPYLSDLIGWELYGSNEESWRRQIRGAVDLYKQKGTKKGIYNAITTVLPDINLQSSSISEFYESYIPYLLYYLLKTDSTLLSSFSSWTVPEAQKHIGSDYDSSIMDNNVRMVVDHILLRAVCQFPYLFSINNYQFNVDDPNFIFLYRNRTFPIPPWEEEKFYMECDVTEALLSFLEKELVRFGVTLQNSKRFREFVTVHTVGGDRDIKFYNNGFLFLTSSINLPPNQEDIINNYQVDKYDYLPLWSGKSSRFDINVSSGSFDSSFFTGVFTTKQDFFNALAIVDEFTPAKSIPRVRVSLTNTDFLSPFDHVCPSVRYEDQDIPTYGFMAAGSSSGVDFRGIPRVFGGDFVDVAGSSYFEFDHTNKPVFSRSFVDGNLKKLNLMGSSVSSIPLSDLYRTNTRRRNYENTLTKGGLYSRTGFNMPSYYNASSEGTDLEYHSLGLLNSLFKYHKVVNPLDVYEVSSYPYDLTVWSPCWTLLSDRYMGSIAASSMFDIRGTTSLAPSTCHNYVARERTPEFFLTLYNLLQKRFQYEAAYVVSKNNFLLDGSSYLDAAATYKEDLWNNYSFDYDDIYNIQLGKGKMSIGSIRGIPKMYKDYITYYAAHGVGTRLLETYPDGGLNILSHAFGPLIYNGNFEVLGSSIELNVSSQLISKSLSEEYPFKVTDLTGLDTHVAQSSDSLCIGSGENRNPYVLSGLEFTDLSSNSNSTFSVFNLDPSTSIAGRENYLVDNSVVIIDPDEGFPRLRYSVKDYGGLTNLLVPEHEFEVSLLAEVGNKNSLYLGGGSFGVWIHTDLETDKHGNSVFWNYMPDGTWRMHNVSDVTSDSTGPDFVRDTLSHKLEYNDTKLVGLGEGGGAGFETSSGGESGCSGVGDSTYYIPDSDKDALANVNKEDFTKTKLKFRTFNNLIKVPLEYYQVHQQVHRADQRYVIELFMYPNIGTSKYAMIDALYVKDITQYRRLSVPHTFNYNNYDEYKTILQSDFRFLYSDGTLVPSGAILSADSSGNLTSPDTGDKITYQEAASYGTGKSTTLLYSQLDIIRPQKWIIDQNNATLKFLESKYTGLIQIGDNSILEPSSIVIKGRTLGSNILTETTLSIPIDPQDTLIILREYNKLQKDLGSRNSLISSSKFGPNGGSRIPYSLSPMWVQPGGFPTYESNNHQYTELYIDEKGMLPAPVASFRKSTPTRYEGYEFPGATTPKYRQLTVYPDFREANASGIVYYDVNIDFDRPLESSALIYYTVSGTGVTNNWVIASPWSIISGNSPIYTPEFSTSATLRVGLSALPSVATWKEYSLIFHLDDQSSSSVKVDKRTDEFRLYVKQKLVNDVMSSPGGGEYSGGTFPAPLWFSATSINAPQGALTRIPANIGGASGPGVPFLNEPCYWYWSAGGTAVSGEDWRMTTSGGTEIGQGHELTQTFATPPSGFPGIYVSAHAAAAGKTIILSAIYEQVELSSQGPSSFSFVSAVNDNMIANSFHWDHIGGPGIYQPCFEEDGDQWVGTPGEGHWVCNSPLFDKNALKNYPDPIKLTPSTVSVLNGSSLPVFYYQASDYMNPCINTEGQDEISYIRKDLTPQYHTDGRIDYIDVIGYTLFYAYITEPTANNPIDHTPVEYVRFAIRDKGSNCRVPGDPDYPIVHGAGDSGAGAIFYRTGSNTWVTSGYEISPDTGEAPEVSSGVINLGGSSILWMVRDDRNNPTRLKYAGVNAILRPVYNPTKSVMDSASGLLYKSNCMFYPFYHNYSAGDPVIEEDLLVNNKVPVFWPLEGNHWEPRGNLVVSNRTDNFPGQITINITS